MPATLKKILQQGLGPDSTATRCGVRALIFLALALMILHLATTTAPGETERRRKSPHDFSDKETCKVCHTPEPPGLNHDPVTTCVKCHRGNLDNHPISRHPIGRAPKISMPKGFSLSSDGRMVCFTCHDPHNRTSNMKLLRVKYHRICAGCHVGY